MTALHYHHLTGMGCPTAKDIQPTTLYDCPKKHKIININMAKGKIVDSQGIPLMGAHIINKTQTKNGHKFGVTSSQTGDFSIEANPNDIIEVSYVGFKTVSYVAAQLPSVLAMKEDVEQLSEVVVTSKGKVVTRTSNNNKIATSRDWLIIGLMLASIGVAVYYGNKNSKKKDKNPIKE